VILTSIGSGLYGRFTEDEKQVRLKMYDPASDGPLPTLKKGGGPQKVRSSGTTGAEQGISKGTVILMALLIFILVIFVLFIMILL
jgi:hypothetical protein